VYTECTILTHRRYTHELKQFMNVRKEHEKLNAVCVNASSVRNTQTHNINENNDNDACEQ